MNDCCPIDKKQCRAGQCEDGVCWQISSKNRRAELRAPDNLSGLAQGIGWAGFWIGLGIVIAAFVL